MMKPNGYPTFADWSKEHTLGDGISDTGSTLRAFLLLQTPCERSRLHCYQGMATVFDSRVACMPPNFRRVAVDKAGKEFGYEGFDAMHLIGNFGLTKRLPNGVWINDNLPNGKFAFNCTALLPLDPEDLAEENPSGQWPLTLYL